MTIIGQPVQQISIGVTASIPRSRFAHVRQRLLLRGFKWDPHVGDEEVLAPFAITLSAESWRFLASSARALAAETVAAEKELLGRPELWRELAVPRPLRRLLEPSAWPVPTPAASRIMRFDFHPTSTGWRVAEVNSDVPGGFTEACNLPLLMAAELGEGLYPAGDPGGAWIRSIAGAAGEKLVALVCAPGYLEDRQIVSYLKFRLEEAGSSAALVDLRSILWRDGDAYVVADGAIVPVGAIVRFYQAEWLAELPRSSNWRMLFAGGKTPVTNDAGAVFTESKGFPLVWDRLRTRMPMWRELLPETRPVEQADWKRDERWLVKEKYSNNGDSVFFRAMADAPTLRRVERDIWWRPSHWIAQRRFDPIPLDTPIGRCFPCIGVYVVDAEPAGIYARLSRGLITDYSAIDVAALIDRSLDSSLDLFLDSGASQ